MGRELRQPVGCDEDFYRWTHDQAGPLPSRQTQAADLDNITEELETLGVPKPPPSARASGSSSYIC